MLVRRSARSHKDTKARKRRFVGMNDSIEPRDLRLKIVPAEDVLLHEETDRRRVDRLRSSLVGDDLLRNPPIAARTGDGRYAVLDGATRTTALKELGMPHILLQVMPYDTDEVQLQAWYHVLPDAASKSAFEYVMQHSVLTETVNLDSAKNALQERRTTAALVHQDGTATMLTLRTDHPWTISDDAHEHTSAATILRGLVGTYGGAGEIYRIVHEDLVDIVQNEATCPCVIMFPTFTRDEILGVASSGDLLPAGITRHLIPGRALNVNMPLERLRSAEPLADKKAWLRSWLADRILAKKVRYYHEPVFIFDD